MVDTAIIQLYFFLVVDKMVFWYLAILFGLLYRRLVRSTSFYISWYVPFLTLWTMTITVKL